MRVLANTEQAVRDLLAEAITRRQVSHKEAVHLYTTGFRTIAATIANWRRRNATDEAIEAAIERRRTAARLHRSQARTPETRTMALREQTVARMYEVIWQGMQQDVAAYATQAH
jgi:hypothetical protein